MVVHIKKLCVGVDSPQHLAALRDARGSAGPPMFITRSMPKRREQVLDGGSIYWIFKGWMAARARIVGLDAVRDRHGRSACAMIFDPQLVLVAPLAHRPFQGWRYLTVADAPRDIGPLDPGELDMPPPPPEMARHLSELGLL